MPVDQGNSDAQFNYTSCFEKGRSSSIDFVEATCYYKLPASQWNSHTQNRCVVFIITKKWNSNNLSETARYFKLSSDQCHRDS